MSLDVLLWLVSVPLVALVHELGHALAAAPAGYRVTSFGIGHGKPLLRWRLSSGTVIYLGRWLFSGGMCVAIPVDPVPRRQWLYHSGGLLVQALLALPLWWLARDLPVLDYVFGFNLVVVAWNLLPVRIGGYATDGWHVFASLFAPARSGQFFSARPTVERVMRFEEQVGSPLGVAWCRLMLRWMDLVVGLDPEEWELDEVLLLTETQLEALDVYVLAEWHRSEGRSLAGLQRIHAFQRAMGAELGDRAGDMLSLSEARCWLQQEEPRMARQALARVAGVGGVIGHEAASVNLQAALLEGNVDEVERAARRLSGVIAGSMLDLPEAVRALHAAAELLHADGRLEAAEALFARARIGVERTIGAAIPEDRIPIARRLGQVAGVELRGDRAQP